VSAIHTALHAAARIGFRYECFHIMWLPIDTRHMPVVRLPAGTSLATVDARTVGQSPDDEIRRSASFGGDDSIGFALIQGERIVCVQWYWHGSRMQEYRDWCEGPRDAVSVHLVTVPDQRSRGYASLLKQASAAVMAGRGYEQLYSRVWWTNHPSLRANDRAGWHRIGTSLTVYLPGLRKPLNIRRRRSRSNGSGPVGDRRPR
jgi:GNAT superfamily N-acetyltransferase